MRRYYEVVAKCGHVGVKNCIWISFAVYAHSGKEAAAIARAKSRVKHDHKDAIRSVKEITFEQFMVLRSINDADPYLHCKNIQQQREICNLHERIETDEYAVRRREVKRKDKCVDYKRKKQALRLKNCEKDWATA